MIQAITLLQIDGDGSVGSDRSVAINRLIAMDQIDGNDTSECDYANRVDPLGDDDLSNCAASNKWRRIGRL
jgi:hypothetical protein